MEHTQKDLYIIYSLSSQMTNVELLGESRALSLSEEWFNIVTLHLVVTR